MTDLPDCAGRVRRITSASELAIIVDIDTGFGGAFNITRTFQANWKKPRAAGNSHRRPVQTKNAVATVQIKPLLAKTKC